LLEAVEVWESRSSIDPHHRIEKKVVAKLKYAEINYGKKTFKKISTTFRKDR